MAKQLTKEQQDLAEELARNFVQSYLQVARHAPEHWTGFELRQLLVDVAEHRFVIEMDKAREKNYRADLEMMPI